MTQVNKYPHTIFSWPFHKKDFIYLCVLSKYYSILLYCGILQFISCYFCVWLHICFVFRTHRSDSHADSVTSSCNSSPGWMVAIVAHGSDVFILYDNTIGDFWFQERISIACCSTLPILRWAECAVGSHQGARTRLLSVQCIHS